MSEPKKPRKPRKPNPPKEIEYREDQFEWRCVDKDGNVIPEAKWQPTDELLRALARLLLKYVREKRKKEGK